MLAPAFVENQERGLSWPLGSLDGLDPGLGEGFPINVDRDSVGLGCRYAVQPECARLLFPRAARRIAAGETRLQRLALQPSDVRRKKRPSRLPSGPPRRLQDVRRPLISIDRARRRPRARL